MAYDFQKINVRGVDFAAVTPDEAAAVCTKMLDGDRACTVFTPNAEIVQLCVEQNEYYALYNGGDLVVPDGAGVVKAARILGRPLPGKVAGVELGERMLAVCAARGDGVYFLGAKPGVAEEAAKRMTEKYPGLRIVGTHDGYFKKSGEESDAVIAAVNRSGAKLLFSSASACRCRSAGRRTTRAPSPPCASACASAAAWMCTRAWHSAHRSFSSIIRSSGSTGS